MASWDDRREGDDEPGPVEPVDLDATAERLRKAQVAWWVAGGARSPEEARARFLYALDQHLRASGATGENMPGLGPPPYEGPRTPTPGPAGQPPPTTTTARHRPRRRWWWPWSGR